MEERHSVDDAFISKLTDIVLANLTDGNFSVENLAKEAGISRITLYRRIRSIKGQDISQFIRGVRLQRAMEMLQNKEGTASEIAFRVGFGSPTYFIKCFHDYYGFPPGEIRKNVNAESPDKLTDKHYRESVPYKDLKSKPDVKSLSKKIKYKKLLITSFGILSALLVIYLLYVLVIKDSDIRPGAKHPEKSIVVLPFKNLSDDPENQYFADGIMEDILNCLFRIREMRVVSRTTSEHFRESRMTSPEIGKELNVNYVLEGSVQRQDRDIRIFVQLIDVRDDQHLISEKYDGEITDIFAFQSDIAKKVADALEAVLSGPGSVVQLLEGEYHLGLLEVHDFYGSPRGAGKDKTIITAIGGIDIDEIWARQLSVVLVKFVGGDVTLSHLTMQTPQGALSSGGPGTGHIYALLNFSSFNAVYEPGNESRSINVVIDNVSFKGQLLDGGPGYVFHYNCAAAVTTGRDFYNTSDWHGDLVPRQNINIKITNCEFETFIEGIALECIKNGKVSIGEKNNGNIFRNLDYCGGVWEFVDSEINIEGNTINTIA